MTDRPPGASLLSLLCAVLNALAEYDEARGAPQEARLLACWRRYRDQSGYQPSDRWAAPDPVDPRPT